MGKGSGLRPKKKPEQKIANESEMPVKKCPNGKYRIGSGQCMYKDKASAERAYRAYLAQGNGDMKKPLGGGINKK